jgi:hypothetical protein
MITKEATARIKINKLLETAGWRFFPESGKAVNICLEPEAMSMKKRKNKNDPDARLSFLYPRGF